MHGGSRYGLQCLPNLAPLPATGSPQIGPPLKISQGNGSPLRMLALVAGAMIGMVRTWALERAPEGMDRGSSFVTRKCCVCAAGRVWGR
jgi:hypothetical protein